MGIRGITISFGLLSLLAIGTLNTHATTARRGTPVVLGSGSTLWLEGKSNVHDFVSRTGQVTIALTLDSSSVVPATPAEFEALVRASRVLGLEVEVPVNSLHSPKAGIDKNLWRDLKVDTQPVIRFALSTYAVTPHPAVGDTTNVQAEGTLSIAGRTRPAAMSARLYRADSGLWLDGSHPLRMTDFGIKPRTMMLGTLRVKDDIVVHYHLLLTTSRN